jgi:hypothetical protein
MAKKAFHGDQRGNDGQDSRGLFVDGIDRISVPRLFIEKQMQ